MTAVPLVVPPVVIAAVQFVFSIFIPVYLGTAAYHHLEYPAYVENAIWIDCVKYTHEPSYKPALNFHIIEYCRSTIHPHGIDQNATERIHDNVYFFQYIDHFTVQIPVLVGTVGCLWSVICNVVLAVLTWRCCSMKTVRHVLWVEHTIPTGLLTLSLIYFTGVHNLPLLLNYTAIMILVTAVPSFGSRVRHEMMILIVLLYLYIICSVIFYMATLLGRSSAKIPSFLIGQFALGITSFSPFPVIFFTEELLDKHKVPQAAVCWVHYLYIGVIRFAYTLYLFFAVFL